MTARTPAPNATGVNVATNVTATFSETVTGLNTATVTLTRVSTNGLVAATVTPGPAGSVTLDPTANLAAGVQYRVNLASGITDLAGNPLAPVSWTFTTAAAGDTTPPVVTGRVPAANATGVARNLDITVAFSESVWGINSTSVRLTRVSTGATSGGTLTPGSAATAVTSLTFNPTAGQGHPVGGVGTWHRGPSTTWTFKTGS